jgi:hypothetical protein
VSVVIAEERTDTQVVRNVRLLINMHQKGMLGGALMPEDVHPQLDPAGADLCHYFTLCMALNYQRDSYKLWQAATRAWQDAETRFVYTPNAVVNLSRQELSDLLTKHRVALQPNKHTGTWFRLCETLHDHYAGDVRNLLKANDYDIGKILKAITVIQKPLFPYLSGPKISNYWLYVLCQYTALPLTNRQALSVAPDTHVIQASQRLGLCGSMAASEQVAALWARALAGTDIAPIDIHTPLWLWSRGGFTPIQGI